MELPHQDPSPRFHQPRGADDPLLHWLRQEYLIALSEETRRIPESLREVLNGHSSFEDWLKQVHFSDKWLLDAAHFTLTLWREHSYDALLHVPVKAVELSQHGVPGMLRIDLAYQWMPHRGQSWAQFRQYVVDEVENIIARYRRRSMRAWGKPRKQPSFKDSSALGPIPSQSN